MNQASTSAVEGGCLLIVDDIADNREVLARRFERRGYEILQAESGQRALELIDEGNIDLVLLDVVMPGIDGLEVLKRVRQHSSPIELPIILVTAQAESSDIVSGLELGANDYITKPVDFAVAAARVATQVGRRRAELALTEANGALERKVTELNEALSNAEVASRAKSDFLANMSHEIRTPLNGVLGLTDALANTRLDDAQRELVRTISSSGDLLARLLTDLLDVARLESGQVELRPQPTQVEELVRRTAAMIAPQVEAKGLTLEVSVEPDVGDVVEIDPTRLTQILTNLLSNAVKFTSQGGVKVEVASLAGAKRFVVRDTGIGFDPEAKARIFERFEQEDASVTKRFGGSGLGLSISRDLAELMGGTLDGYSEPGRGAVFTLEVPAPNVVSAKSN